MDSLYLHHSRVEAFKPVLAAEKALEAELVRRCDELPADAIIPVGGQIAQATLGPKSNKRTVTAPAKLFRLMKKYSEDAFQGICSFALADVDRFIPADEHKHFLSEARSGKRSVEVFARPSVEKGVEATEFPKAA